MAIYDGRRGGSGLKPGGLTAEVLGVAVLMAFAALAPGHVRAAGTDLCKVASPDAVGRALHATVVRAEAPQSDPGCEYSVKGTPASSTSNHAIAMAGAMGGAPMDPGAAKAISAFSNAMLGDASAKQEKQQRHPGEIPVLVFVVSTGNAQQQMKANRDTMGRISPLTTVPGLGDDAFETSGSMLMVRKGDKFVQFIYTQCDCSSKEMIPLAKQIVAAL